MELLRASGPLQLPQRIPANVLIQAALGLAVGPDLGELPHPAVERDSPAIFQASRQFGGPRCRAQRIEPAHGSTARIRSG